jgi:hypothetical protein
MAAIPNEMGDSWGVARVKEGVRRDWEATEHELAVAVAAARGVISVQFLSGEKVFSESLLDALRNLAYLALQDGEDLPAVGRAMRRADDLIRGALAYMVAEVATERRARWTAAPKGTQL